MRILLYDIETAPILGTTWGMYEQNLIWIVKDWYMLCFSYKWLDERKIHVIGLPDFPRYKRDPENDVELVKKLHSLFDEADVIIAHNGNSFDQKMVNTRIMVHKLGPPSPAQYIDTKLVAKRFGRFTSNKLDDLGKSLSLGQKLSTGGAELWKGCMKGDVRAWTKMMRYNKQDVRLLEQLYLELRPWIANHPSMNLLNPEACPKCKKGPMHSAGWKVTKTNRYRRYRCQSCRGYSQERTAEKTLTKVKYVN